MKNLHKKYKEILINPVRQCASYNPKFGQNRENGITFQDFQILYGQDAFYHWLGLDNQMMYAAHKAAGGITSIYRQIGIGCEQLIREIFKDYLNISDEDVNWSYQIKEQNGKTRELSLDGRIVLQSVSDIKKRENIKNWMLEVMLKLGVNEVIADAMTGVVFEVRQGYKSKDSKRQNADLSNALSAYTKTYLPCVMVMSSQIDIDIVNRYTQNQLCVLRGVKNGDTTDSTYRFINDVIGFDIVDFMEKSHKYFSDEINIVLNHLLKA